jgi:PAS domain S-box-containing protein
MLNDKQKQNLDFKHLPAYASYLLAHRLEALSTSQVALFRELKVPMMRYYELRPEAELLEITRTGLHRLLSDLSNNDAASYIEHIVMSWVNNVLPVISRNNIAPEDVTYISMIRRKMFRSELSGFTTDEAIAARIIEEVELLTITLDSVSFTALMNMQRDLVDQTQRIAHIGNWIWDLKSDLLTWSDELFRIHELTPTTAIDRKEIRKLTNPADQPVVDEEIRKTLETHEPHDFIYRIMLADGTQKTLHARGQAELSPEGVPVRLIGTLQDITEQVQTNQQLRKTEERYQSMITSIQDYSIIFLDPSGIIENWNKGASKIHGYAAEEVIGQSFKIFYTKDDIAQELPDSLLAIALETGHVTHEGYRLRKDGSRFYANTEITTLYDRRHKVIGFTKITKDLTEKKISEDKLREFADRLSENNRRLEQVNKELESFNYVASHDLQEPLRKIQAFTSRLVQKENANLSEWGQDVFAKIVNAAERMQKLIDALLNFSRLENDPEARQQIDMNELMQEIVSGLQTPIEKKDARIDVSTLPMIDGIPIQISQLFTNLLSNALKYSKSDRRPEIKITADIVKGKDMVNFRVPKNSVYHHFMIADNGIGFDQQYANKIFELFQRLHGRTEYEGTGIGLAICKKIVQHHQGFICAQGVSGEGSKFHIYLPAAKNKKQK